MIWSFGDQLARRGVGIFVTLFLARILAPEDFGLIAMITVFMALGQSLMESGFRQALIRLPVINEVDYSTAFYANIGLGCISYGILFMAAPGVALFFGEARLVDLVRVGSLAIIINSFQVVQVASLSRNINFKAQMQAGVPASIVSGVIAITLAQLGFGVWALIYQSLSSAFVHTSILWWSHGWRPKAGFKLKSARELYRFGGKLFVSGGLDTLFKNIYPLIIAKIFSAPVAGLYFFADRVRELVVSQLLQSIQAVTYPALSKKQMDKGELKINYRRVIKMVIAVYVPTVTVLIMVSPWGFELALSAEWFPAHYYLQMLLAATLLYPINSLNLNILKVLGRSDIFLMLEIFKKAAMVVVILVTSQISVEAMLWGQVIQSLFFYFPNKYYSDRLINYSFYEQFRDVILYYSASGGLAVILFYAVNALQAGALMSMVVSCFSFFLIYACVIFFVDKPLINDLLKIFRSMKR